MTEYHFIQNERTRELLQVLVAILGIVGVIIGVLSFIY